MAAFHGWFDGLKTMKLIHHLSAGPFARGEPEDLVPGVLEWAGLEPVQGIDAQLNLLREMQIGEPYEYKGIKSLDANSFPSPPAG